MDEIQRTLGDLSAVAAALITLLTLLSLLGKALMYALSVPGRVRRHFYKPRFILLPSAEELAQYSPKNDNALFVSEEEWLEELRGWETRRYDAWVRKSQERVAMLYYATYIGGGLLLGRMLTLTWKTGRPENIFILAVGLYMLVAWFSLLRPLALQPRRARGVIRWNWSIWRGWTALR